MAEGSHSFRTPDGRYIIVCGRLWRAANPSLPDDERQRLVKDLMDARRGVKASKSDAVALAEARSQVNRAKTALGERGPVWWDDGAPDLNRRLAKNTVYAEWASSMPLE
jgi:hypothetical protein